MQGGRREKIAELNGPGKHFNAELIATRKLSLPTGTVSSRFRFVHS